MNDEQTNDLAPDYLPRDPEDRQYVSLVSVTLTLADCALLHALLGSLWVHPDSWEYTDQLLTIPDQIAHCVSNQGFKQAFDYEKQTWSGRLAYLREKRFKKLLKFASEWDFCGTHELVALAPKVTDEILNQSIPKDPTL